MGVCAERQIFKEEEEEGEGEGEEGEEEKKMASDGKHVSRRKNEDGHDSMNTVHLFVEKT